MRRTTHEKRPCPGAHSAPATIPELAAEYLSTLERGEVLQGIATAASVLSAAPSAVFTYDPVGDALRGAATAGAFMAPTAALVVPVESWQGAAEAIRWGHHSRSRSGHPHACLREALCIPLEARGELLGLVAVARSPSGSDGASRHKLMELAAAGAIALDRALIYGFVRTGWALERGDGVARQLHDTVAQTLFAISMTVDKLRTGADLSDRARAQLDVVVDLCSEATDDIRAAIHFLRAEPSRQCLVESLHELAAQAARRSELEVSVSVAPSLAISPGPAGKLIYRVCREGLWNVERHAHATTCSIRCDVHGARARWARVLVTDDGEGMGSDVVESSHFGLSFLREAVEGHGGSLELVRRAAGGFELAALIPIAPRLHSLAAADRLEEDTLVS